MDSNFVDVPVLVSGGSELPMGGVILTDGQQAAIEGPEAIVFDDQEYVATENGVAMGRYLPRPTTRWAPTGLR